MAYSPLLPPGVGDARFVAITDYIYKELRRLEEELKTVQLPELSVAPTKPRTGMVALADGTNWNPGAGAGFYGYYGGAWVKLG